MFNDDELNDLPPEGILAVHTLYLAFKAHDAQLSERSNHVVPVDHHDAYIHALGELQALMTAKGVHVDADVQRESTPDGFLGRDKLDNIVEIRRYFEEVDDFITGEVAKLKLNEAIRGAEERMGALFRYEFRDQELERVQEVLNELRELIARATALEEEHRERLLARLERLQGELHKRVSDLDRFWGLVGDAGIVLRKLGEDAKPIVDRIRELADIVFRSQSRAEGLTDDSSAPLLSNPPDNEAPGEST